MIKAITNFYLLNVIIFLSISLIDCQQENHFDLFQKRGIVFQSPNLAQENLNPRF